MYKAFEFVLKIIMGGNVGHAPQAGPGKKTPKKKAPKKKKLAALVCTSALGDFPVGP